MMSPPLVYEMRCPADRKVLSWVRGAIVHTAAELGFVDEELHKIEMSVDEACANVVDHAYPAPPDVEFPMTIRVEAEPGTLRITVTDRGVGTVGFPGAVKSAEEYARAERHRGLGTYIMQRFMDQVEFTQTPGEGTCVTMVKHLTPDAVLGER